MREVVINFENMNKNIHYKDKMYTLHIINVNLYHWNT